MIAGLVLAQILGAAFVEKPAPAVFTWGERIQQWTLNGKARTLAQERNGAGGCAATNGDLYLQESGGLVRRRAPYTLAEIIEKSTDFTDCLPAELFGRRGVLVLHMHAQVRFYMEPDWSYRELYSIYTASRQGALAPADIDGDGLLDLFVGNYAMLNPGALELPWRLHAINLWHEHAESAQARIAVMDPHRIVWAESEASPARVALFEFTGDFRQTWRETRLPGEFHYPRGVAVDAGRIFVGDATGIRVFDGQKVEWVARGFQTLRLWTYEDRVIAVTPKEVRVSRRRRR